MLHNKKTLKLLDKGRTDYTVDEKHEEKGEIKCNPTDSKKYTITVSKKPMGNGESEDIPCSGQKSFISIHSTDELCHVDGENSNIPEECNVEVLSLKEVFPSSSEESVSQGCESPLPIQEKKHKKPSKTQHSDHKPQQIPKTSYMPTNSKSSVMPSRLNEPADAQPSVFSDYDIPKNTMHVVGSNPGEPKMCYPDPPKKISKTMKKFLRNIDKYKNDQGGKSGEKTPCKLTKFRSILKDSRCVPECTGDSMQASDDNNQADSQMSYQIDWSTHMKQKADKNVTFNTEVVMIHFRGELCVGQSVEALSKEKEQQARNSELRKTYLAKYNEFWHAPK